MEEILRQLSGKKVDVSSGITAVFRGDVVDVNNGVLYLRGEDEKLTYVAIDKIAAIYECGDTLARPGFIV